MYTTYFGLHRILNDGHIHPRDEYTYQVRDDLFCVCTAITVKFVRISDVKMRQISYMF